MIFEYMVGREHSMCDCLLIGARTTSHLEMSGHRESVYQALAEKFSKKLADVNISFDTSVDFSRSIIRGGRRDGSLMLHCFWKPDTSIDEAIASLKSHGFMA